MATGFTFNASWNGTSAAADGDTYVTFTEDFSFDSVAESFSTIDYFPGGSGGAAINGTGGSYEARAQSFVSPATGTLRFVRLKSVQSGYASRQSHCRDSE